MSGPAPTGACPDCTGLAFQVRQCACTDGGDRLLVDSDSFADEPYRDCRLCRGDGGVAEPCAACARTGLRRAELVVSVVNLDTGAVASERLRPDRVVPERDTDGTWVVPLGTVADRLVARAGVGSVHAILPAGQALDTPLLWLPRTWRPDLPVDRRWAMAADALIRADHSPWRVLVGRVATPPPEPSPGRRLGELCRLAGLLHLDLVVEARWWHDRAWWDLRFELPGGDVPEVPRRSAPELADAVTATTAVAALAGLAEHGRAAPAYTIRSSAGPAPAPAHADLAALERRIHTDLAGGSGAQAIWRDGRWWHTPLRPGGIAEVLHEQDTGQVVRHATTILLRVTEPPEPAWWGASIRHRECPRCSGAGAAPTWGSCATCGDSRRLHSALTVTVTDLTRVAHRLWQPVAGEPVTPVGTQPDGTPVVQLRGHYRAAELATPFGVRPEDLTRLDRPGRQCVGQDLLDGTVTCDEPGVDPATRYVEVAARGLPGARLLVLARPPDVPPVADLLRLGTGLDLAVVVTAQDHRRDAGDPTRVQGVRWRVEIVSREAAVVLTPPWWPSLEAAVADGLDGLGAALSAAVPIDPRRPVPAPEHPPSPVAAGDPTLVLRRLARRYAGEVVAVRVDRGTCQFWLAGETGQHALTAAVALPDAATALRFG
ncbi:hypothetical protein [Micromonospora sp. WMMD980]|uniref:hypothetical protein n=1 Tax=Micromonospora sp. WMMD980 TaxID=3016088 RepID=UPI002416CC9A|nr:hypothetical protein [Micromonospora sp. WMMD980]MDG4799336.1 hypothetical protein [Micromonospora sp. WMMD980]